MVPAAGEVAGGDKGAARDRLVPGGSVHRRRPRTVCRSVPGTSDPPAPGCVAGQRPRAGADGDEPGDQGLRRGPARHAPDALGLCAGCGRAVGQAAGQPGAGAGDRRRRDGARGARLEAACRSHHRGLADDATAGPARGNVASGRLRGAWLELGRRIPRGAPGPPVRDAPVAGSAKLPSRWRRVHV